MKHRLGVSVGVVLLGIGVAPFWMGKSAQTAHPGAEKAAVSSSGKRDIMVASAADDYIPPLLGFTDDDLIDNPRLNPVLALTGGEGYDEPGRLTFAAEYLPHLPVAPSLLLMGGYDAPRLTPFPNPGMPNLFGGNQFDNAPALPLDNSSHAFNGPANPPAAPASINPAAPLTYPRPTPGLAQPMANPQGPAQGGYPQPAQGGYGPPAGQYPGGYANVPPPGLGAPPSGPGPGFGAAPQYPMGQPEMLAYAGPESVPQGGPTPPPPMAGYQGAPRQAAPNQLAGNPGAGYQQAGQAFAAQGYPQGNFGPQAGYGYGQNCGCQNGQGFGGHGFANYGSTFGGYVQNAPMMEGGYGGQFGGPAEFGGYSGFGGQSGFGGFHGGMSPVSYGGGSFGEEIGCGGFGGSSYGGYGGSGCGCGQPNMGCCSMPVSCCGSEMGGSFMGGGMSYGGPINGYGGCCTSSCGSERRGFFCRLKDWFKGGSRSNDCDNYNSCCNYNGGCNEQKSCGLFSRIKNLFRKKKDNCCGPTPIYSSGDCGGFEGGYAGGFSGGYGYQGY